MNYGLDIYEVVCYPDWHYCYHSCEIDHQFAQ